ncbi:MAG: CbtA family protein [Colwellia sp.]|jgi:cobalt transporter subunit CbtA (proposed)
MLFRRIIFSAILIGIFSGAILSTIQIIAVTPILLAAEAYEVADKAMPSGHQHHQPKEWAPQEGFERTGYTVMANILAAIGFASFILVLLSHLKSRQLIELNIKSGLLCGLGCYLVFFVIPSLGLPPEIPGSKSDALQHRQSWWLLTAIASALGLLILAFSPLKYKLLGIISLAVPFIVGAPHLDGPDFTHPDPEAVNALINLHHEFIVATSISSFIFWLILAASSLWLLKTWVYKPVNTENNTINANK